jgi:hypothetical protein
LRLSARALPSAVSTIPDDFTAENGKAAFMLKPTTTKKRKMAEMKVTQEEEKEFREDKAGTLSKYKMLKGVEEQLRSTETKLSNSEFFLNSAK